MNLERVGPWLVWGWRVWAHFTGMAVIALAVGIGIVQAVSGNDAVLTVTDVRDVTERAAVRGRYGYTYDSERHEACPGEVVIVFATADAAVPAVVTLRRPAALIEPRAYPGLKVSNPLPDNVTPGQWDVTTSLVSHCANRQQIDIIARFRMEVTAS